jgi:hypothetical protein
VNGLSEAIVFIGCARLAGPGWGAGPNPFQRHSGAVKALPVTMQNRPEGRCAVAPAFRTCLRSQTAVWDRKQILRPGVQPEARLAMKT